MPQNGNNWWTDEQALFIQTYYSARKKNVTDVYNIDEFEMHFSKWKISDQKGFYVIPFIYFFKICKTIRQTKVQWLSVAGDGKQGLTVKGCE